MAKFFQFKTADRIVNLDTVTWVQKANDGRSLEIRFVDGTFIPVLFSYEDFKTIDQFYEFIRRKQRELDRDS